MWDNYQCSCIILFATIPRCPKCTPLHATFLFNQLSWIFRLLWSIWRCTAMCACSKLSSSVCLSRHFSQLLPGTLQCIWGHQCIIVSLVPIFISLIRINLHVRTFNFFSNPIWFTFTPDSGISSTVRRCIEKETGREFAAKIIDLAMDSTAESTINQMMDATRQEIAMLRHVMGHPYISKYT